MRAPIRPVLRKLWRAIHRPSNKPPAIRRRKRKRRRIRSPSRPIPPPSRRPLLLPPAPTRPSLRMSRILLADDSPHAQRMGERILREEGFEVVSLTDGNTTLLRLDDVDPDLILADVF